MRIEKSMNNKLTTLYIGDKRVYFSYETPIAFWDGSELFVSENEWSRTTGRHLNAIDGGDRFNRIPHCELMSLIRKYSFINLEEELYDKTN